VALVSAISAKRNPERFRGSCDLKICVHLCSSVARVHKSRVPKGVKKCQIIRLNVPPFYDYMVIGRISSERTWCHEPRKLSGFVRSNCAHLCSSVPICVHLWLKDLCVRGDRCVRLFSVIQLLDRTQNQKIRTILARLIFRTVACKMHDPFKNGEANASQNIEIQSPIPKPLRRIFFRSIEKFPDW
jgi:hypothetical protein